MLNRPAAPTVSSIGAKGDLDLLAILPNVCSAAMAHGAEAGANTAIDCVGGMVESGSEWAKAERATLEAARGGAPAARAEHLRPGQSSTGDGDNAARPRVSGQRERSTGRPHRIRRQERERALGVL